MACQEERVSVTRSNAQIRRGITPDWVAVGEGCWGFLNHAPPFLVAHSGFTRRRITTAAKPSIPTRAIAAPQIAGELKAAIARPLMWRSISPKMGMLS